MALRERFTLGVRLLAVLGLLAVLFAGVVYLTILDSRRMVQELESGLDTQSKDFRNQLALWHEAMLREHARQMAAPFLWGVETLRGLEEGTPAFRQLQTRMWQFVYGREAPPVVAQKTAGPLESVVIIDLDHRIVAASDPMVVDSTYSDPEEVGRLREALARPQITKMKGQREDGQSVLELSVGVPNSRGEMIGVVRMRYVGGETGSIPALPRYQVAAHPRLWGPLLAGIVAVLGVGFGALATGQVIRLTRRIEAMAAGERLVPLRGPGAEALSVIEEKLGILSGAVRRDDPAVEPLMEALREGVVLLDASGRVVLANRQAGLLLGMDEETLAGQADRFGALVGANPLLGDLIQEGLHHRHPVREMPLGLYLPGGREVALHLTTYLLYEGDVPAGMMLVFKDREAIESLDRNLREASSLQAIAQLTGSFAHEVKNPLSAVGIHLDHLQRRLGRTLPEDESTQERVGVIRDEIERLRGILEEWLRLTAPEERDPGFALLDDVLASVAYLLRVEARHHRVELLVEQSGPPVRVALSAARLRQVLLNLSLNGIQAMPSGGRLTLRSEVREGRILLEVEDTGCGIPLENQDRVFNFHFTTKPGGSGLGLPICRRLVEGAQGRLSFVSQPGKGTRFTVDLPAALGRDVKETASRTVA